MSGTGFADRLAEAGLPSAEVEAKRRLADVALAAFSSRTNGASPQHGWWVPGRLEVFGKHTDYCGGHSLVATVPRGFVLLARGRQDGQLCIYDAGRREEFSAHLADRERGGAGAPALTGWRNYVHTVRRRLSLNFPDAAPGADISFVSDLPPASGMSSSSALMVGIAAALTEVAGLRTRTEWGENIRDTRDEAAYYACIENGMAFGSLAGEAGVGTYGGSEDHAAVVCGRPGWLALWSFAPLTMSGEVHVPDDWKFVIASSGVAADKTGSAKHAYNRLSREAAALLALWNAHEAPQRSLGAALTSRSSAPDRLRDLLAATGAPGSNAPLDRRLQHFMLEDLRPGQALEAIRDADRARLGELADASQRDAEELLGNQVPETTALVRSARALGAFAASSFGAGFGGSVWALTSSDDAKSFAEEWLADYQRRYPNRTGATVFVSSPGPGLLRLF